MNWRIFPLSEFGDHERAWAALNARLGDSVLLDPLFLSPLIAEFSKGDEILAICGDPTQPAAMGIFRRSSGYSWQTFQPSNAPLGAWLRDPASALETLLPSLARALPGPAILIGLTQLDPSIYPRPARSATLRMLDYIRTARIHVEGEFEDYWRGRGKNLRHNIKRQNNRLTREAITPRLEVLTQPSDMPRAISDYSRLEMSGWKAQTNSAVGADDAQGRFYITALQALGERHEALVCRYHYNDRLVASDLCVERGDTLIVLKTAHDSTEKMTSPAHLMRYELFQRVFAAKKVKKIEFYGPVMDWHTRWAEDIRTMYHLNSYRWPGVALVHDCLLKRRPEKTE